MFFDINFDPSVTVKTPEKGGDILTSSHNNLYQGVSMSDLKNFKEQYALNSRLVKINGKLVAVETGLCRKLRQAVEQFADGGLEIRGYIRRSGFYNHAPAVP